MIRTGVALAASAVLGVAAGFVLYVVSVFVLFVAGLSFYAVNTALPFALLVALIIAFLVYRRTRRLAPHVNTRALIFMAGVVAFPLYGFVGVAITQPHTILFLG
jgi:ABC-type Fe3+-siderophore transport system permease subunit